MSYNFVADGFHIKKLCSRLSSREVQFRRKTPFYVSEPPPGGLWATYAVRLRLIGKRVVMDFLLMLIKLFSPGVTAKARYERESIENRRFRRNGPWR